MLLIALFVTVVKAITSNMSYGRTSTLPQTPPWIHLIIFPNFSSPATGARYEETEREDDRQGAITETSTTKKGKKVGVDVYLNKRGCYLLCKVSNCIAKWFVPDSIGGQDRSQARRWICPTTTRMQKAGSIMLIETTRAQWILKIRETAIVLTTQVTNKINAVLFRPND